MPCKQPLLLVTFHTSAVHAEDSYRPSLTPPDSKTFLSRSPLIPTSSCAGSAIPGLSLHIPAMFPASSSYNLLGFIYRHQLRRKYIVGSLQSLNGSLYIPKLHGNNILDKKKKHSFHIFLRAHADSRITVEIYIYSQTQEQTYQERLIQDKQRERLPRFLLYS